MTYNLFLDDQREPHQVPHCAGQDWVVVRSKTEAMHTVNKMGVPDFISYDHDLTDCHYIGDYSDRQTGADFAAWVTLTTKKVIPYKVHSMNPDAEKRIFEAIRDAI